MLKKNDVYTVTVTDLNNLGYGVARIDGVVVFIANAVDGDLVRITIIKVARNYCIGKIDAILIPSPDRQLPACSVSTRCGSCMYMHITYEHELLLKRRRVLSAFTHAGLPDVKVENVVSTNHCTGYRNKIQLPVQSGKVGYYATHSHRVIEGGSCALQHPCFDAVIKTIRAWLDKYEADAAHVRHLYLRCTAGTNPVTVMVCLVVECRPASMQALVTSLRSAHPEVRSIQLNFNEKDTNVILGDRTETVWGDDALIDQLGGLHFRLSAQSFYQVNHDAAEIAYCKLLQLADIQPGDTLLDLYCGTGTIGLFLKKHSSAGKLRGVEVIPSAVEDARKNAIVNHVQDAEFTCDDALSGADSASYFSNVSIAIVDPPRKGCSKELLARLCKEAVPKLLYMSCDPETLARDTAYLTAHGYTVGAVTPIDLFPRTGHVEAVVLFSWKNAVHNMQLYPAPFEMIKGGQKTIELRLFDKKRQQIKAGDTIVFTNTVTGETLSTIVIKLHRFDSFADLYKELPLLQCGYTVENVDRAKDSDMEQYYSLEEQKKYGVVGIELCRLENMTGGADASLSKVEKNG